VTRRPASRRPPKLDDPARERAHEEPKGPTARERLKTAHVAGRSTRFGRDEVVTIMRRLVEGDARVRLGLPPFRALTMEHVELAVTEIFGWKGDGPRARLAPACTLDGFTAARNRVREVARAGGSLAFATGRPASLLKLYGALAAMAVDEGGTVLENTESGVVGPGGRRLWWIDGVAVLTDHESLLADHGTDAADELLFTLPRPTLVVADRSFAGVALAQGLEVVAFADIDALALAVAAWRGLPARIVPLDERRPPQAYSPLIELVGEIAPLGSDIGLADLPVLEAAETLPSTVLSSGPSPAQ
jgi:Phosphatase